jgi:hypothetical protein
MKARLILPCSKASMAQRLGRGPASDGVDLQALCATRRSDEMGDPRPMDPGGLHKPPRIPTDQEVVSRSFESEYRTANWNRLRRSRS